MTTFVYSLRYGKARGGSVLSFSAARLKATPFPPQLQGDDVAGVVGTLIGIEEDVLASGTDKLLEILNGKFQSPGDVGKRARECDLAFVEIEGKRARDLIHGDGRSTEIIEIGDGRAGAAGGLTVEDSALANGSKGRAVSESEEGIAGSSLTRDRKSDVFAAIGVGVLALGGERIQGFLGLVMFALLGYRHRVLRWNFSRRVGSDDWSDFVSGRGVWFG